MVMNHRYLSQEKNKRNEISKFPPQLPQLFSRAVVTQNYWVA